MKDRKDTIYMNQMNRNVKRDVMEKAVEGLFLLCALVGVVSVIAIIVFVFYKGLHPFFAL